MGLNLMAASKNIHNKAIVSISRFPTKYFDEHTTGRIMGKMSNDVGKMDEFMPWMGTDMLQVVFITMGSILAMVIGNPAMILLFIPLMIGLWLIFRKCY